MNSQPTQDAITAGETIPRCRIVSPESVPPAELALRAPERSRKARPLILVVDDEACVCDALAGLLGRCHEVLTAADGESALAVARQRTPDLIVTDIVMPRLSGIDLVRALRSHPDTLSVPVVLMSGWDDQARRLAGLRAGASVILAKPILADELLACVESQLELARLRQEQIQLRAERFTQATIDALTAHICVMDATGEILATNAAWRRFREENHAHDQRGPAGSNYLTICDVAARADAPHAAATGAAIRSIVRGEASEFEVEYDCPTPGKQRRFIARFTGFKTDTGVCVVAAHEDITERHLAEEALRQSEAHMAHLIDNAADAIITVDEHQRIRLFNRGAEAIFGCRAAEMLGQPLEMLLPMDSRGAHRRHVAEFGRSAEGSRRMGERQRVSGRRMDGTVFPAEASISKQCIDGHPQYTVFLRDATERYRVEQEIRAREAKQTALAEFLRRLLQNLPLAAAVTEAVKIVTDTLGKKLAYAVELLPDRSGVRVAAAVNWRESLAGREFPMPEPDSQIGLALSECHAVLVRDLPADARFADDGLMRDHGVASGITAPIGDRQLMWGALGIYDQEQNGFTEEDVRFVSSITQLLATKISRDRAERAVQASERELRLFTSATNDAIWALDLTSGQVERSVGFEKHFGYPGASIEKPLGWWQERVHPLDCERVMGEFQRALESGRAGCSYQYRFRKADGSYATVEDRVCIVRDESGKAVRALGAMTDLTAQVEHEAATRRSLHQLMVAEEAERRRIARELHDSTVQGLVAVMMNLEFIREKTAGRTAEESAQIEDSLAVLENCAHDIRTLSYLLHPPRLDEAGLEAAVRHYLAGFGERTGLATSFDCPQPLERLGEIVELILFRIVQEALGNIHRHAASRTAKIRLQQDAGSVMLEVRDEGRGIPENVMDPQSGAFRDGKSGVGMAAMRERLRQVGGQLTILSNNRGVTVRAQVPITRQAA